MPKVFVGDPPRGSEVWLQDLSIKKGEFIIIAAESGTGKSSLCSYIFGARKDYEGKIYFNDTDVSTFKIPEWQELRRTSLAYLPQELGLFPELSAWENIKLKNDLTGHKTDEEIMAYLERLGIADRKDFPVGKMSVGQQQRVGIIRAICQPFDFLMLDEPVSHLDENNNRIAAEMVMQEARRQNAGIIATSVGNHLLMDAHRMLNL